MTDRYIDEVEALHRFFESWLTGSVEQSREIFQRFENALADGFIMIPPNGNLLVREELLEDFWQAHGSIAEPFKIEIRNAKVRRLGESLCLVIYEEWQLGREQTARISSALMSENKTGLQWLNVQETWLAEN